MTFATLVIAVATAAAAWAAYYAAQATRQAAQGQLFYELLRRYSSAEMHEALKHMGEIAKERKENEGKFEGHLATYARGKSVGGVLKWQVADVDRSRRAVSHFFVTALELYDHNRSLDEKLLKAVCGVDVFRLFYLAVEWLERPKNPKYNRKAFTRLLDLSDRDDAEELTQLRPPAGLDESPPA